MWTASILPMCWGIPEKSSSEELTELNEEAAAAGGSANTYSINDVVGKSGIEAFMETTLQGTKGFERVIVDNTGKGDEHCGAGGASVGNDVYLTIDKELTEAVYNIVEQKMAGLLSSKIVNAKTYVAGENSDSSDIVIPIYDVYFALIDNQIIDVKRYFPGRRRGRRRRRFTMKFLAYRQSVYDELRYELTEGMTPYNQLSTEYQVYQSNIVQLLNRNGVIMTEAVDSQDSTQIAWASG